MDQVTLFWTLVSTFLAGFSLFVQKVVAEEKRSSAFNGFMMYGVTGIIALGILSFQKDFPDHWLLVVAFGLAAGGIHGIGNFIRMESLRHIDSVIFFPLNKLIGPFLVVIGGIVICMFLPIFSLANIVNA